MTFFYNLFFRTGKSGLQPSECAVLSQYIVEKCHRLHFAGLMTIGAAGHDFSRGPNPDFELLRKCREKVCGELGLNVDEVGLSMGMSVDYEEAVSKILLLCV